MGMQTDHRIPQVQNLLKILDQFVQMKTSV